MQPVGAAQAQFFLITERTVLVISFYRPNLLITCALLFGGKRMPGNRIVRSAKHRHARGNQFFVPAGQSAVAEKSFQKSRKSQREPRHMRDSLEHVGHHTSLLQQAVIQLLQLGRHLLPLEQGDASCGYSGHVRTPNAAKTGSAAANGLLGLGSAR